MPPSFKKCPNCLLVKCADAFYLVTRRSGKQKGRQSLSSYCRMCTNEVADAWKRRATPAALAYRKRRTQYMKAWADRNPGIKQRMWAAYSAKNREKLRAKNRAHWAKMTPEQRKAKHREASRRRRERLAK